LTMSRSRGLRLMVSGILLLFGEDRDCSNPVVITEALIRNGRPEGRPRR
jgi:hypothetical protein